MRELCDIVLIPQTRINKSFTFQCRVKDLSFSYSQEARSSKPWIIRKKNFPPTQEDPNEYEQDENEEDIEQDDPEGLPIPSTEGGTPKPNLQSQLPLIPNNPTNAPGY